MLKIHLTNGMITIFFICSPNTAHTARRNHFKPEDVKKDIVILTIDTLPKGLTSLIFKTGSCVMLPSKGISMNSFPFSAISVFFLCGGFVEAIISLGYLILIVDLLSLIMENSSKRTNLKGIDSNVERGNSRIFDLTVLSLKILTELLTIASTVQFPKSSSNMCSFKNFI